MKQKKQKTVVYILNKKGKPLMPTTRCGHVRKLLDAKKAVEKYLKNGAQPSSRVAFILKKNGVKMPKWYKEAPKKNATAKHADRLRKNQPKEESAETVASTEVTSE